VAICLLVKEQGKDATAKVHYADLWGLREGKYKSLFESDIATTDWMELSPSSPYYLFINRDETDLDEYENGWKVTEIFPVNVTGIQTHRDHFVTDFNMQTLHERIAEFRLNQLSDTEIAERYNLKKTDGWSISDARKEIAKDNVWEKSFIPCLYRPFDIRSLFYHKAVVDRPRFQIIQNI
jgi:predicted helicase